MELEFSGRENWSEMQDNWVRVPLWARVHRGGRGRGEGRRGMAKIIMRTNDLYTSGFITWENKFIRYIATTVSDYTVNRYLTAISFIRLSLISTDYLSGGNIQVSTNNYNTSVSLLHAIRFAKIQRDYDINGIIDLSRRIYRVIIKPNPFRDRAFSSALFF